MLTRTDKVTFGNPEWLFASVIALVSVFAFFRTEAGSPGFLDMGVFFERLAHPEILQNDFYTNATLAPNVRQVYGYFIYSISVLTGLNWQTLQYVFSVISAFFQPVCLYLLVVRIAQFFSSPRHKSVIAVSGFLLLLGLILPATRYFFSIAWWPVFITYASAQALGFTLGLIALHLLWSNRYITGSTMALIAGFFHPPLMAFCSIFALPTMLAARKRYKLLIICGMLIPGILSAIIFRPHQVIPAEEYAYIYTTFRHPHHYLVSEFANFNAYKWYLNFLWLTTVLLFLAFLSRQRREISYIILFMTASYVGSIFLQYFATQIIPVKIVIALGPSRYTMFGGASLILALCLFIGQRGDFTLQNISGKIYSGFAGLAIALCFVLAGAGYGKYQKTFDQPASALFHWISTTTNGEKTFALPPDAPFLDIFSMQTHRALVAQEHFPFREDFFREFYERSVAVYGDPRITKKTKKDFYYAMSINDWKNLNRKYHVEYIVKESKLVSQTEPGLVYRDKDWAVIALDSSNSK